jgi:rubredoxin
MPANRQPASGTIRDIANQDQDKEPDPMKTYMCVICGYVYDEAKGDPDHGLEPGTRWEDVPLNWTCPECGAGKEDFEMTEI